VSVLAVADGWYRTLHPHWQRTLPEVIADVSQSYQQHFGIRFVVVDVRAWDAPTSVTLPNELAALKRAFPIDNEVDVVAGFTVGSGLLVTGIAEILGNHLLVAVSPFHSTSAVLEHELAHIFGADDGLEHLVLPLLIGPVTPVLFPPAFVAAVQARKWRVFRLPPATPVVASVR
jgi:hypothetical protein